MDDLTDSKLQTAYALIKAEQRDQARRILIPVVQANPDLADGWFLLGHAVNNPQEKIRCFQRALRLDPDNSSAQKQLARLLAQQSAPKKKSPVLLWGLAGLFICLSGLGFLWGSRNSFFANLVPIVPSSATPIPSTVTLVASTSTPGSSPIPKPTPRPTITLPPTRTPQPSVTTIPTLTLTFTATPSPLPRANSRVSTACVAPNGMGNLTAPFKFENFGNEKSIVYLKGVSPNGNNPISCQTTVKQGVPITIDLVWGNYEYIVLRGGTVRRGTFFINQPTKATMRIYKDKIQIGPFP